MDLLAAFESICRVNYSRENSRGVGSHTSAVQGYGELTDASLLSQATYHCNYRWYSWYTEDLQVRLLVKVNAFSPVQLTLG